jgi:hypothetical protein
MTLSSNIRGWLGLGPREAPVLQESPPEPLAICECNAWHGFMVEVLFSSAFRIGVRPGDPASRVLDAIPPAAHGVLVHLNASVTRGFIETEEVLRTGLRERGQRILNLGAVDVRKSTLHARCSELGVRSARADREGPPDERLVVKTTLNFGGQPERLLREQWGERAAAFTADVSDAITDPRAYLVTTRAQVPTNAWDDRTLVVERFIENAEGLFFRVYAAGPAGVVSVVWVDGDIKKLNDAIRRRRNYFFWTLPSGETVTIGPSSDRALRALAATRQIAGAMHFDFIGADCVMDREDEIVMVDANKTPYWGHPRQSPILSHLRHGFNSLVGDFT